MKHGPFEVRFADQAREDLMRLLDFLLERAEVEEDLQAAFDTVKAMEREVLTRLAFAPTLYRPAHGHPMLRELVVSGPAGGYLALFDITNERQVTVLALRHQLEDDYL